MLALINIIVLLFVSYWVWRGSREKIFWTALTVKLLAGISVGLIYKYYYTAGDTWNFFHDAERIVNAIISDPSKGWDIFWKNDLSSISEMAGNEQYRAIYFTKWVSFINVLNGGNYWITSLWFSFASFTGSWILYQQIKKQFESHKWQAALAFLFVPSIVFWGSGIIKESLAIACLFILSSFILSFYRDGKIKNWNIILAVFLFWILWNLKYYWSTVWFISAAPLVVLKLLSVRFQLSKMQSSAVWIGIMVITILIASLLRPNFHLDKILSVIVDNRNAYVSISKDDGLIHFYNLEPSVGSFIINSPWAVFSAFFRPSIIESHSLLQWLAAIENLVLLILVAMSLVNAVRRKWSLTLFDWSIIIYIVLLAVFLALSTPNLGSLSRFRIGFMPYLWFLSLIGSGLMEQFSFKRPS